MCQIQIIEHDCKSAADHEHDLIQAALWWINVILQAFRPLTGSMIRWFSGG